jgi:hypothetical protein
VFFDRHARYTNFSEAGLPPPLYVNIVREPVSRTVSWYAQSMT